jgi:hypothetical protein
MALIVLFSCKKDVISNVTEANETVFAGKVITLENVSFAKNISPNYIPATYDEGACTVKVDTVWHAGTKCFESVGNTCSRATNCVPIQNAASSGRYTKEEIDRKIELVEKAYGIKYLY